MKTKKTSRKSSSKTKKTSSGKARGLVDQMLVKVSPQLQTKIDQLIKTLETSKRTHTSQLSLLASKILLRAQEVSKTLRQGKTTKKK